MRIKKIIFTVLLSFIMFIQCINVNASDNGYKDISKITDEELKNAAINFASGFCKLQLDVSDIVPIYNYDYKLIGYSLSYICDDTPYGYINFDFTKEDFISDFAINEGEVDIFTDLDKLAMAYYPDYRAEKMLLVGNYLEYTLELKDGNNSILYYSRENEAFDSDGLQKKKEVLEEIYANTYSTSTVYNNNNNIFTSIPIGSTMIEGPCLLSKYDYSLSALSDSYIKSLTGKYACAVVALTEIAGQEGILLNNYSSQDDKIHYTFDTLWSYTNTFIDHTLNSIVYGGTYDVYLGSGFRAYCYNRGKEGTTFETSTSPSYTFYKTATVDNASATLTYRIYVYDGSTVVESGHTVNVLGYCKASYSGVTSEYLLVANGWDAAVTCINLSEIDFVDKYGIRFYVS